MRVRGGAERTVISNIDYNARGQRILCQYANPESDPSVDTVRIEYDYDPKTFRLAELRSFRGTVKLQHLVYTYDPVGNIVALRDHAEKAGRRICKDVTSSTGFLSWLRSTNQLWLRLFQVALPLYSMPISAY